MSNDSASGGPLLPEPSGPAPLEGQALNQYLQTWLAGMTGLDSSLVRPRLQAEPANIPPAATAWAAFGISPRKGSTYTFLKHQPDAEGGIGNSLQIRHEQIDMLCSFFDLGVNGQADSLASLVRDGMQITQNLEPLMLQGFGFQEASELIVVPSLMKERWLYRVDLAVVLWRQTQRLYPIRNVLGLAYSLTTNQG